MNFVASLDWNMEAMQKKVAYFHEILIINFHENDFYAIKMKLKKKQVFSLSCFV